MASAEGALGIFHGITSKATLNLDLLSNAVANMTLPSSSIISQIISLDQLRMSGEFDSHRVIHTFACLPQLSLTG